MFEGSECAEVEGGSTQSTVASSISACKKVCVLMEAYTYLCVPLVVCCVCAYPFYHSCYLSVRVSSCAKDFHFLL